MAGIKAAILGAGSTPTRAQRVFGPIYLFPERMTTERNQTKSLRKIMFKLPVECGLA